MEKYVPVIMASKQIKESAESLATLLGVKSISHSDIPPEYSIVFPLGKSKNSSIAAGKYICVTQPAYAAHLSEKKNVLLEEINTQILNQESASEAAYEIKDLLDAKAVNNPAALYEFSCYVFFGRVVSLVVTKDSTRAELLQKEVGAETAADLISRGFIADPEELIKITCDAHEVHPKLIKACSAVAERIHHEYKVCLYALKGRYSYEKFNSYDNVTLNDLDKVSSHIPMRVDSLLMNPSLTRGNSMVAIADAITEITETINLFKSPVAIEGFAKIFENDKDISALLKQASLSDMQALYRAGQFVSSILEQEDQ